MNFFEHQDRARRRTTRLVILFLISVVAIVAMVNVAVFFIVRMAGSYDRYARDAAPVLRGDREYPGRLTSENRFGDSQLFIGATAITLLIIGGGSAYKMMILSRGGPAVAQLLGGRPLQSQGQHSEEAVLRNVVEEMSIASGVPMPQVYVLDREEGINAFAAGFSTDDAVIGVTRGAMTKLNRDELQGVIAHEFSHILNGDMRLNLRLIGILNGILVVSLIGYALIRSLAYVRTSGRRNDKAAGAIVVVLLLGAALYLIGSVGVLFGRLIQAAVSRQREFLADASAVQFTRNPAGLVGALKKLGGYSSGSRVQSPHAMETAHLFFASGFGFSFGKLLATHPPLEQRIRAIDPTFDGRFDRPGGPSRLMEEYGGAAVASALSPGQRVPMSPQRVLDAAGGVAPAGVAYAAGLLAAVPPQLSAAARDPFSARAIVLALLISANSRVRDRQLTTVRPNVEPECFEQLLRLLEPVSALGDGARLPVLDLTLPALRQLSPQQSARLRSIVRAMIEADGRVTLFEFALIRLLEKQLMAPDRSRRQPMRYFAVSAIREEAAVLLSALAAASSAQTERAFAAGARQLDSDAPPGMAAVDGLGSIDSALRKLAQASPPVKQRLIAAAASTVAADGEVNVTEAELLRVVAATLDVPLPPLLSALARGE